MLTFDIFKLKLFDLTELKDWNIYNFVCAIVMAARITFIYCKVKSINNCVLPFKMSFLTVYS